MSTTAIRYARGSGCVTLIEIVIPSTAVRGWWRRVSQSPWEAKSQSVSFRDLAHAQTVTTDGDQLQVRKLNDDLPRRATGNPVWFYFRQRIDENGLRVLRFFTAQ
jgi:CelD/BcsL family acetyltransferase involved in cellulose biosynthesis